MAESATGYCPAHAVAILSVTGPDARSFLHAQLTQDLRELGPGRGAPAAWLDPQGRVRACFDVVPLADGFDLLGPASLADTLVARLGMFVLRADVAITRRDDITCFAIIGDDAGLATAGISLGPAPFAHTSAAGGEWLRLGPGLSYAWGDQAALAAVPGALGRAADTAATLAEIGLGRPQVDQATESRFTAQMLNLDLLGAIAFDKGCYPGQEIVARAHNLGTVKRRLFRYLAPDAPPPPPGTTILDAAGKETGTVIRAARSEAGAELLAVTRIELVDSVLRLPGCQAPLEHLALASDARV